MYDNTSPTKHNNDENFENAEKYGVVVAKQLTNSDEYQSDVILNIPERFFPMLSKEDISR